MIHKTFANGKIEILITDVDFGRVTPGDKTFKQRLEDLDLKSFPAVWMDQKHTSLVVHADSAGTLPATDGVYSRSKELMLITRTADCCPILLWNEKSGIIAALHAGWKGFLAGIIDSFTYVGMNYEDCDLSDFSAFLGPHLRVGNFEVQQNFIDALAEEKHHLLEHREGKNYFNLTKGVVEQLQNINITDIEDCGIDTYSSPEYYSYRKWSQLPENERPNSYSTFANCIVLKGARI